MGCKINKKCGFFMVINYHHYKSTQCLVFITLCSIIIVSVNTEVGNLKISISRCINFNSFIKENIDYGLFDK